MRTIDITEYNQEKFSPSKGEMSPKVTEGLQNPPLQGFALTPRARTSLISSGVGVTAWAVARQFWPQYQTPILIAGGAVGTIAGELYEGWKQQNDLGREQEGMNGWLKDAFGKAKDVVEDASLFAATQIRRPFDLVTRGEGLADEEDFNTNVFAKINTVSEQITSFSKNFFENTTGIDLPTIWGNDDDDNGAPIEQQQYQQEQQLIQRAALNKNILYLGGAVVAGMLIFGKNKAEQDIPKVKVSPKKKKK